MPLIVGPEKNYTAVAGWARTWGLVMAVINVASRSLAPPEPAPLPTVQVQCTERLLRLPLLVAHRHVQYRDWANHAGQSRDSGRIFVPSAVLHPERWIAHSVDCLSDVQLLNAMAHGGPDNGRAVALMLPSPTLGFIIRQPGPSSWIAGTRSRVCHNLRGVFPGSPGVRVHRHRYL